MKKSEMYRTLQRMLLQEGSGCYGDEKLAILRELMKQEDLAAFEEKREVENQ